MKRLIFIARIFISAALIAFVAISPPYIIERLARDPYKEFLGGVEDQRWSGVISVWHIVEFKTYQGSVTAYLEGIAAQYERGSRGVYIEVYGLTPDAMRERLSRGERPDIWSAPMGILDDVDFAPLLANRPVFMEGLAPYSKGGAIRAYPYLVSGYYLMSNTQLLQGLGLSLPEAGLIQKHRAGESAGLREALQSAMGPGSVTRFGALCAPELIAAYIGVEGKLASEGDFKAGQVPFMIGDARACGDMARKMASGGFTFDSVALGGFTDQVLFIGPDADISGERAPHADALIELVMDELNQLKLTALGAVPVIPLSEPPTYADSTMAALYEAYSFPLTFDAGLYAGNRDALAQQARGALAGEAGAGDAFLERFSKLLYSGAA